MFHYATAVRATLPRLVGPSVTRWRITGGTLREAFARVVSNRGAPLRRVYQKRTPLEADFYLPE